MRASELYSVDRLEAAAYGIDARAAIADLRTRGIALRGMNDARYCVAVHNAFRFRRVFVGAEYGIPFLSSSDIIGIRPKAKYFLSRAATNNWEALTVQKWDVLISRSGTIGNVALASQSFDQVAVSEDVIRLSSPSPEVAGYLAAVLRHNFGRLQLRQAAYGSVITHIESHHLSRVLIPDLAPIIQTEIGNMMIRAAECRHEANALLDQAESELMRDLRLPPLDDGESNTNSRTVRASQLGNRLEGSYHSRRAQEALSNLRSSGVVSTTLGDPALTREIRAVTKFRKRVYVRSGGIPMLSSKQLFQVDPIDVKRLAKGAHDKDLPEISLDEGMVTVTCSGTIGRVHLIPAYMAGWTSNQHSLRLRSVTSSIGGFLYAWLASQYGQALVQRFSYGSVIQEIDREMMGRVHVPEISEELCGQVGQMAIEASILRTKAWKIETQAKQLLERHLSPSRETYS